MFRWILRATRRRLALLPVLAVVAQAGDRLVLNFNPDWRFIKADVPGAAEPGFDDGGWESVSTPHTYNDTDTFDNWSTPGHRGEQIQWSGRTWYRKTFVAPEAWRGRSVFIEFEAVRQVADVYLNGEKLGTSKTGFTPFGFDLTRFLKIGGRNVVAVSVDNRFMADPLDPATAAQVAETKGGQRAAAPSSKENPNLRALAEEVNRKLPDRVEDLAADQIPWNNPHWHPAHGGIYRNVRLIVTDPLHVTLPLYSFLQTEGPYAYAREISPEAATIGIEVPVWNGRSTEQSVRIKAEIRDAQDVVRLTLTGVARLGPGASRTVRLSGTLKRPHLWEPDYPYVYRIRCRLESARTLADSTVIPLGIRAVRWDAAEGFFINGHPVKLHGWGQKPTNEWPGLGAALPDWMQFYTLAQMKAAGGNYLRWGHAAAGPAQIDAADALGLVTLQPGVDGESDTAKAAWTLRAAAFRDVLIYFRNHPSILIWEGGNQKVTRDHVVELRGLMDKFDPWGGRAYTHRRADRTDAEYMDVGEGTEGGREISWLPVVEGEYDREESPRRVWDDASPPHFGYPEAKGMTYQLTSEQFAVDEIAQYRKISARNHAGGANWIFSDTTSGGRVPAEVARASGEVDGVRLPKEAYYVCQVLFSPTPQVHLIGHWTYPAGTRKTVYVAANADEVELALNGRVLGRAKPTQRCFFVFPEVAFEPGELVATARRAGNAVAVDRRHTVGEPVALRLTPITGPGGWRADGEDIALVDVEAVDAHGDRCPTNEARVDFEVAGPAVWRGGYNSGKLRSINNAWLDLECGINRVAVRSTRASGEVTLRARSAGLSDAVLTLRSVAFAAPDGVSPVGPARPASALPAQEPSHPPFRAATALIKTGRAQAAPTEAGRFIRTFAYTGPQLAIVHVETNAREGAVAYVDRDFEFSDLPPRLVGADWVQVADADQSYSAVDLMEMAVSGGCTMTIAHDSALPEPEWLTQQFDRTEGTLLLQGRTMALFEKYFPAERSVTLGSNTDRGDPARGLMYLVFVKGTK